MRYNMTANKPTIEYGILVILLRSEGLEQQ